MTQDQKTVGAIGAVRIDALEITITPLSQADEMALERQLRRAAEAEAGDHYTRCKPVLDAMKDSPADRLEAVREIVRMCGSRAPLSGAALFDFRASPAGLAIELFARGKKATPGLTREGLVAVITETNADLIATALFELIEGGDPKPTR